MLKVEAKVTSFCNWKDFATRIIYVTYECSTIQARIQRGDRGSGTPPPLKFTMSKEMGLPLFKRASLYRKISLYVNNCLQSRLKPSCCRRERTTTTLLFCLSKFSESWTSPDENSWIRACNPYFREYSQC